MLCSRGAWAGEELQALAGELWETLRNSNYGIPGEKLKQPLSMLCSQEAWPGGQLQAPVGGLKENIYRIEQWQCGGKH